MTSQSELKRTIISMSLAICLAIVAFSIYQSKNENNNKEHKLEAKVYPKGKLIMEE